MFSSIKQKLTFIYIILIIIPLVIINYWSVENMKESVFRDVEVNTLKAANIISGLSQNNLEDVVTLKRIVKQYVLPIEGRLLILDSQKRALVDSFNHLENQVVNNIEIRDALEGQEKIGYYYTGKYILQVAVPITASLEGQQKVQGVVFISTAVDSLFERVREFRQKLIYISFTAALIGVFVAILASGRIAKPILILSRAAKRIGQGNLGEVVHISSRDEIGKLAENFNHMSKELYRIDKGRTQFIGDVSHELKTPLASMKALIDSLIYGDDDIEVYREYLKDMDTEIDRLSGLVKSLLNLAKIQEQDAHPVPVSLQEIVEDAVKILKPLAEKSEVKISTDFRHSALVFCDPDRIREVMINLIDNAIKYRDPLKTVKRIWITGKKEKSGYLLTVRDNGIGIAKDDLDSIFEKFYRTDLSRSRDTGGAGIGLSIVNRIIQLHQWLIRVDSRIGEGTTFTIIIPKNSLKSSL